MNKNIIKIILAIIYPILLIKTDSYIEPYILISILAIYSLIKNKKYKVSKLDYFTSIFLSLCISLANYNILNIFTFILVFIIGILLFIEIIKLLNTISINTYNDYSKSINNKLFIYTFLIITIVYIFILIFTRFPGTLSPDSINQIKQILTNSYTNHHPYYHTLIIRLCLSLSSDLNVGVLIYSIISILLSSFTFSYVVSTIYKVSNNLKLCIIIACMYLLMPYYIEFSYTMWKDVYFSLNVTLCVVSIYKILKGIDNNIYNYLIYIISSIGVCLFRSNGYFVYVLSFIFLLILFKDKKLIITSLCVILFSFILKYPLLNYLKVESVDIVESLSIPTQQISRVIVDNKQINKDDLDLLNSIVDTTLIPSYYNPNEYDSIKNLIKDTNNQYYLKEHLTDYISLYIRLGIKYPLSYISAFIDQTKGYYNSGYEFFRYGLGVEANDYGINQVVNNELLYKLFNGYSFKLFNLPVIRITMAIGLYFWILILTLNKTIKDKRKEVTYLCIPLLMIVLSLCIATPVYSEFRYVYSLFTTLPFMVVLNYLKSTI